MRMDNFGGKKEWKLYWERNWKNGQRDGLYRRWDPNGQLKWNEEW